MAGAKTKTINLATARQRMKAINEEIRYISCFKDSYFNSGVIAFAPKKKPTASRSNTMIRMSSARYWKAAGAYASPAGASLYGPAWCVTFRRTRRTILPPAKAGNSCCSIR